MLSFLTTHRPRAVNYACFDCHRALKQPANEKYVVCPDCARPLANVGNAFPLPSHQGVEAWETAKLLFKHQARIEVTVS